MKLKISSNTGIGKECKILMVHLLSMEIILFSLLFASYCSSVVNYACQEQILSIFSYKDLSVIKTSLFYFSLFTIFIYLYAPPRPTPTKSEGVLCYTLRTFECLSVRPSAFDHSCPLSNFDTVQDNFTKLGTNIKHDQTTCRD